jgi:outer membrane protein assembly factor BamB
MRISIAVVAAVFCTSALLRADNWPEFRGPTGQGHAVGPLPTEWGPDKNIAWKQAIPGIGWSSPVVWDGRVYLTTAVRDQDGDSKDLSLRALCLDAATGKILWNAEAIHQPGDKVPKVHAKNSDASPTPIVDGKRLFAHFGHLGTACLDLTGKVLWRNTELAYEPVNGNGGSPITVDDLLIFSIDGADKQCVVALEQATGNIRWLTDRKSTAPNKFSFSTPLAIDVDGRRQIVSSGSFMVAGYAARTGEEIWRVQHKGYSVIPRPVFGHGMVYLSTSFDSPVLLAIQPSGTGDVTKTHVSWTRSQGAPQTPSALLDGQQLYVVSDKGIASCLDAITGKVHWSERLGGAFSASPLLADGKIYFQNEEGTGYVVKAGTTFQLLATNVMHEKTLASYAVADGAIFLRSAEFLYRIGTK